jgi:hypothetical protein
MCLNLGVCVRARMYQQSYSYGVSSTNKTKSMVTLESIDKQNTNHRKKNTIHHTRLTLVVKDLGKNYSTAMYDIKILHKNLRGFFNF